MNVRDQKVDIRALAELARVELSDDEVTKLEQEIPGILAFVETIQNVSDDKLLALRSLGGEVRNVMRADADPHESGTYTEALLSVAPSRVGNRVAVKQVLSRRK